MLERERVCASVCVTENVRDRVCMWCVGESVWEKVQKRERKREGEREREG